MPVRTVPVILQSEASECGLACLAMILNSHGSHWDVSSLRDRFSTSSRGITLRRLVDVSRDLSLNARPLRVELEYVPQLELPCVLHWGLMHYVVLVAVNRDAFVIHDPALGRRAISASDFSRSFTGVAVEFERTSELASPKRSRKLTLASLFRKVNGIGAGVLCIVTFALLFELLQIMAPFYLQWTVDWVLGAGDVQMRGVLLAAFSALLAVTVAVSVLRSEFVLRLRAKLHYAWLVDTFQHLLRLPLGFFERRYLGDLASRFEGISQIQRLLTGGFFEIGLDGLMSVLLVLVMLRYSKTLVVISGVSLLLALCVRRLLLGTLNDHFRSYEMLHASQHGYFLETVKSMQSIKLFSAEGIRLARWANMVVRSHNRLIRAERIQAGFRLSNTVVFGGERLIVIWYATALVLQHSISVGMLFSYIAYRELLAARIISILDKYLEIKTVEIHLDRLADIAMAEPEDEGEATPVFSHRAVHCLELDNVWFRYSDDDPWLLQGITLRIEGNESLAITGKSGCGKSTLLKLMLGLLPPTKGTITFDGRLLKDVTKQYRALIGAVQQSEELFAGTIAENISFFDMPLDIAKVERCAMLANIDADIKRMPMQYNTLITDTGMSFSGGQKQRILLARALYKEPRLLFLDEATSHLDPETEEAINSVVGALDITRIVVAHRKETIESCDRVLVMKDGQLNSVTLRTAAGPCL